MRYLIALLTVALATLSGAETLEQLKARMLADGAADGVIAVGEENGQRGSFLPGVAWITGSADIYYCRLVWVIDKGETAKKESKDVLFVGAGDPENETVFGWLGDEPDFLKAAPADAYITGRTQPFTAAQVESFCNTQWRATNGNSAALAIKEFAASNVDANTIRVSGLFHDVAANTRPKMTFLITLVDANGATTGANVKFEKVIE